MVLITFESLCEIKSVTNHMKAKKSSCPVYHDEKKLTAYLLDTT